MKKMKKRNESRFREVLSELEKLNNIGLNHSNKFKSICMKKKQKLKQELNQLIIRLRKSGCDDPSLKRYI